MGKTRDLFKKIRDTKGTFHAKMGIHHIFSEIISLIQGMVSRLVISQAYCAGSSHPLSFYKQDIRKWQMQTLHLPLGPLSFPSQGTLFPDLTQNCPVLSKNITMFSPVPALHAQCSLSKQNSFFALACQCVPVCLVGLSPTFLRLWERGFIIPHILFSWKKLPAVTKRN